MKSKPDDPTSSIPKFSRKPSRGKSAIRLKGHGRNILAWMLPLVAAGGMASASAASLTTDYTIGTGSQLLAANGGNGAILFNDSAALGGSDVTGTGATFYSVLLNGSGHWSVGDTVSITGIAMALTGATADGTFTFDVRQGAGGTGDSGAGGLASIGTQDAVFATTGTTSTYYVNFDTPVTFVADTNSTSIVINWSSTAQIRWKKETAAGAGRLPQVNYSSGVLVGADDSVRFSVAGTVTPAPDSDNDGLSDVAETGGDYAGGLGTLGAYNGPGDTGTFYNNPDSDGDGIKDGEEVNGEPYSGFSYTSNPTLIDTDKDSVEDGDEVNGVFNTAFSNQPTNPGNRDTDNDGLGDKFELTNGLDPRTNADFDNDTYSDFDEVKLYGSDPKIDTSKPGDGTHPAVGSFTAIQDAGVTSLVGADLTPTLGTAIINEAGVGGNDFSFTNGVTSFVVNYPNAFPAAGSAVSISGFAWPVVATANNVSGDILLEFFDPGADGVVDGVDNDLLVGTAKGTLTVTGSTTVMYWNFTPINFTSSGTALMVKIQSTESLQFKAQENFASGEWYANDGLSTFGNIRTSRFSIGGTATLPSSGYSGWQAANSTRGKS